MRINLNKPDDGRLGCRMDKFFELKTAVDLREKLRRDFAKIEAKDLEVNLYFNFFITAESILEWSNCQMLWMGSDSGGGLDLDPIDELDPRDDGLKPR